MRLPSAPTPRLRVAVASRTPKLLRLLAAAEFNVVSGAANGDPDVVVLDAHEQGRLRDACAAIRREFPRSALVVVGAQLPDPVRQACDALRGGADEFVANMADTDAVVNSIRRVAESRQLVTQLATLEKTQDMESASTGFLGNSAPMVRLKRELACDLTSMSAVTLVGERGSGKLTIAHALHCHGATRGAPLSIVDCRRLASGNAEASLWDHRSASSTGLLSAAAGGTLLLKEVASLSVAVQDRLAHDLARRRMRPLGSRVELRLDARILCTSTLPLEQLLVARQLSPALHRLIGGRQLRVPPLRERGSDILVLAQRFLVQAAARHQRPVRRIAPAAAAWLLGYSWPGNVTELAACVHAAVLASPSSRVTEDDLSARVTRAASAAPTEDLRPWDEVEREHIFRVLADVDGNKSEAARLLGISRKTLYRKLDAYTPGGGRPGTESGVHHVDRAAIDAVTAVTSPARSA